MKARVEKMADKRMAELATEKLEAVVWARVRPRIERIEADVKWIRDKVKWLVHRQVFGRRRVDPVSEDWERELEQAMLKESQPEATT